jgi:hypothetical protein
MQSASEAFSTRADQRYFFPSCVPDIWINTTSLHRRRRAERSRDGVDDPGTASTLGCEPCMEPQAHRSLITYGILLSRPHPGRSPGPKRQWNQYSVSTQDHHLRANRSTRSLGPGASGRWLETLWLEHPDLTRVDAGRVSRLFPNSARAQN